MSLEVLTETRRRLIVNGYLDLLLLVKKANLAMPSAQYARIRDGWDAVRPPTMDPITSGTNEKKPNLILPFSQTTKLPHLSQVQQYAAAAELKELRGR